MITSQQISIISIFLLLLFVVTLFFLCYSLISYCLLSHSSFLLKFNGSALGEIWVIYPSRFPLKFLAHRPTTSAANLRMTTPAVHIYYGLHTFVTNGLT